jgi:hypothetical protein
MNKALRALLLAGFWFIFGKRPNGSARVVQRECCWTASDQAHAPECPQ